MTSRKKLFIPVILGLALMSCETEVLTESTESSLTEDFEEIILGVRTSETPTNLDQKTLDLISKNHLSPLGAQREEMVLPGGTKREIIRVEGDIVIFPEDLEKMNFEGYEDIHEKHYRTNALVSPKTITIIGFTGGSQALSNRERTALTRAVANYNQLNLSISFNLTFGTNFQDKDMVVYNNEVNNPNAIGGQAGFPSGGNPFKFVQIYGLNPYSLGVIEHVITHEIGHSVGFRHTDFFSRQSCGQNTNEGAAGVGANYIPGTPRGYDPTSLMLACFNTGVSGNFNTNDVIALNFLY